MAFQNKVTHLKEILRAIFPKLQDVESIYDAQTVVNALSGFIAAHVQQKMNEIKLSDIEIDLSKEKPSKITAAILEIKDMFGDESAKEFSESMERFGKALQQYSAQTFMKQPMTTISVDDIVSK